MSTSVPPDDDNLDELVTLTPEFLMSLSVQDRNPHGDAAADFEFPCDLPFSRINFTSLCVTGARVSAGVADGGVDGSAGSTDNGADSFVPRGGRGTDMRARGSIGGTDSRGDVYENTQEGPAGADRLQTTSPPPSLCPDVSHTDSVGALIAFAVTFLSHRITGSFTHPVRLRPSASLEVPITVRPSPFLSPVASPHYIRATLHCDRRYLQRHAHTRTRPAPPRAAVHCVLDVEFDALRVSPMVAGPVVRGARGCEYTQALGGKWALMWRERSDDTKPRPSHRRSRHRAASRRPRPSNVLRWVGHCAGDSPTSIRPGPPGRCWCRSVAGMAKDEEEVRCWDTGKDGDSGGVDLGQNELGARASSRGSMLFFFPDRGNLPELDASKLGETLYDLAVASSFDLA
ncbi:hypothetical protein GGX14DRAFT_566764 [Mycena pura]|uniref:Uncharacterized protein n=1 Tax=Mycena pura TaxID=153505 RepID=A0AAD6VJ67_9AGAR|nr:hypothetical protein GGX14DRAFT_566764 [Mycena pura]